jgi:putative peptidoglycan lipid II flippase
MTRMTEENPTSTTKNDHPSTSKAEHSHKSLLGSTAVIAIITGISRIFGLVREQVRAVLLGTTIGGDAFSSAFIIPNLLRRLVGEGAMTAAFLPTFTDFIKNKDKKEVWNFAGSFFLLMSFILVIISILGVAFAPLYMRHIFARGYTTTEGKIELTIFLTKVMFPYIFFIGLAALAQAILNAHKHFAIPAATPIALNLAIITTAFSLSDYFENPATAFAIGVIIGGSIQLLMQIPQLIKIGFRLPSPFTMFHGANKKVLKLMVPGIFGAGIYQINVAVSQAIASAQQQGAVSSLQYSSRILELILGIFVVSLATVTLPQLSRFAADGNRKAFARTGLFAIRLVAFVTIPATIGTILLRGPIVDLLFRFKGGVFNAHSSELTQSALLAHITGLFFIGTVRIAVNLFFALKDTKTPVIAASLSMACNIGLCFILPAWFNHAGIALANSIAAAVQLFILTAFILRKLPELEIGSIFPSLIKISVSSALMGIAVHYAAPQILVTNYGKIAEIASLAAMVLGGIIVYLAASTALSSPETSELLDIFKKKQAR